MQGYDEIVIVLDVFVYQIAGPVSIISHVTVYWQTYVAVATQPALLEVKYVYPESI